MERTVEEVATIFKNAGDSVTVINTLAALSSLTDEQKANFKQMKEYIDEVRDLNNKYKDSYTNDDNWTYKTKEDVASDNDKKTAGGMAEEVKNDNFIPSDYRPGL